MTKELNYELMVDTFFKDLFERNPEIETMFSDKGKQRKMMIVVLQIMRELEGQGRNLDDYIQVIGMLHRGYGLTEEQMSVGHCAFARAIDVAGKELSDERKAEYQSIYTKMIDAMELSKGS